MAIDFTTIIEVRQWFGDDHADWNTFPIDLIEEDAPFVGLSRSYSFRCPGIDRSEAAVLQFESIGVSIARNVLRINGIDVPGGISPGPDYVQISPSIPLWKTHSLIVPVGLVREENILEIASAANSLGNFDDFVIDNMVIFYKLLGPDNHSGERGDVVAADEPAAGQAG